MKTLQDILTLYKNKELDEAQVKKYLDDITVFDYIRPCIVIHNPGNLKEYDTGAGINLAVPDICLNSISKSAPWYNNPSVIVIFGYEDQDIINSAELVKERFPGLPVYIDDFETFARTKVFFPAAEAVVTRLLTYNNVRTFKGLAYLNKSNETLDKIYFTTKDVPLVKTEEPIYTFLAMDSHRVPTKVQAGNNVIRNDLNDNVIGFSNKENTMNCKQFSTPQVYLFSLSEISLMLEALVKYKNFNVTDPSKAKLIKAMNEVSAQLTAMINDDPNAEVYSLKGFTAKDFMVIKAAIAWLDIDPAADPEVSALSDRLRKLKIRENFKKGAAITGTVIGTAALVAGTAYLIKYLHDKKVKTEAALIEPLQKISEKSGVSMNDLVENTIKSEHTPKADKAILSSWLKKNPIKLTTEEVANQIAKNLTGGQNA